MRSGSGVSMDNGVSGCVVCSGLVVGTAVYEPIYGLWGGDMCGKGSTVRSRISEQE